MLVKQLSVFIENKSGRLKQITEVLGKNKIDLVTLQVADTKDFGIMRSITSDNEKAVKVLREAGFTVSITELIGVQVKDKPGALGEVLEIFNKNNLSIEYLYSFTREKQKDAIILFRVDDCQNALKVLKDNKIEILTEDIYL